LGGMTGKSFTGAFSISIMPYSGKLLLDIILSMTFFWKQRAQLAFMLGERIP
jgi:hypothetical protein